jgi:pyridoxamine 5'-phosphate oxidase family protein
MGATRKFRNVQANGQVALVIDDPVSRDPWTVRGLQIRGVAPVQPSADLAGQSIPLTSQHPGLL